MGNNIGISIILEMGIMRYDGWDGLDANIADLLTRRDDSPW